jgi:hypothetical protein
VGRLRRTPNDIAISRVGAVADRKRLDGARTEPAPAWLLTAAPRVATALTRRKQHGSELYTAERIIAVRDSSLADECAHLSCVHTRREL